MTHLVRILLAACGMASALSPTALGKSGDAALSVQVDAAVRRQMADQKIPGLSLVVLRDGKTIKATGYGFADLEFSVAVTPRTVFEAGSITKQFTAAAVMMLVDDGRVRLDDSIAVYFPDAPTAWAAITIRNLLGHTSGIPDYWGDAEATYYSKGVIDFRREYTDEELVRAYAAQPLDFRPGEQWRYSSSGYNLLGILIHRVTGKTYGDFLKEKVFVPLHMDDTRVFSWTDIVPRRAQGYDLIAGEWRHAGSWMSQSVMAGADGGLLTSAVDLAKWDAALYTTKILKRTTLELMWTPLDVATGSASAAGLGWFIAAHGHRVLYHTGGGFGFYADISRYVDDHLTIVVMTNVDETHTDVLKLVGSVAEIYLPDSRGASPTKDW